jgi:hypothetical protein
MITPFRVPRRRGRGWQWYFVTAVIAVSAVLAFLAADDQASEAAQRARLASKQLDNGRFIRVTGSETSDGACIAVRISRSASEFCGLAAPGRDELRVAEAYGGGVTSFVIYAGKRVSAVRVEMASGALRTKRLRRARNSSGMEWFEHLRFGLLVRKGAVSQPALVALGRDGKPLDP